MDCKITSLVLASNHIGPAGANFLKKAFKANRTVTALDVSDNNLPDEPRSGFASGVFGILKSGAEFIKNAFTSTQISPQRDETNIVVSDTSASALVNAIFEALKEGNTTLTTLNVGAIQLSEREVVEYRESFSS